MAAAKKKEVKGSVWSKRIQKAEKFFEKAHTHGQQVYARYKDDRTDSSTGMGALKRVNLFYANVNTIKESLFNSLPKPDISRLHKGDYNDDASRVAALIIERGLTYELECSRDFSGALKSAILDRLVPGIGQVWVRFGVDTEDHGTEAEPDVQPVQGTETIFIEQVYWEDFGYEPARSWERVGWVFRKLEMTKKDITARWGAERASQIEAYTSKNNLTQKEIISDKYCVYEIWDKTTKTVVHWAKGLDDVLDSKPDPYGLKGFFPCPPPLIANPVTSEFLPVTDYHIAQDQYVQLDHLYARMGLIIEAIKVAGCYNAAATEIGTMLQGQENKLIPVDNWAMYAEQGGAKGMIDWFPVEQVVMVLEKLQAQFDSIKMMLQEVSGMSDIVRGASNQYETAKAQQIKAQFASVRMNGYQRDVAEFVTHIIQIMAEMMIQLYSQPKLEQIVGRLDEADLQFLPQAVEILQNDFLTSYKVSIKADSLVQSDWALEKGQRMELMGFMSQFLQSAVNAPPDLAPLLLSLVKWTITGFRGSAEVEGIIDRQLDGLAKQAKAPKQPPPPSPEEMKAKADLQAQAMETQREQQAHNQQMQLEKMQAMADLAVGKQKADMDMQLQQMKMQHEKEKMAMEERMMQLQLLFEQRMQGMKLEGQVASQAIKAEDNDAEV